MWPLSVFLFVATAAPQQKPPDVLQNFSQLKLPIMQHRQPDYTLPHRVIDQSRRNTDHAQLFLPPAGWQRAGACRHDNVHTRERFTTKTSIAPATGAICSTGRNERRRPINEHP